MNNVTRRPLLNRSLPRLGTTIFAEMSARSVATGSLNLGQGFPDRDGRASVARAAADAILAGRGNQYPPGPGVAELREAADPREREVLALMAEGRSNVAIAQRLLITEKAVSKHAAGIFAKLDLAPSDDDNRRVLAVLAYLDS
jgi:N-succinyldiaminopimelate aminotransferase